MRDPAMIAWIILFTLIFVFVLLLDGKERLMVTTGTRASGPRRIFGWFIILGLTLMAGMIGFFLYLLSKVGTTTNLTSITTDIFLASGTIAALLLPTAQLADQFTGRLVDRWTQYIKTAAAADRSRVIQAAARKYNRGETVLRLAWLGALFVFISFFLSAVERVAPLDDPALRRFIASSLGLLVSGLFLLLPLVIYAFDFSSFRSGWDYIKAMEE